MDRREFLRLSFGALVASKLPALPTGPVNGDNITWAAAGGYVGYGKGLSEAVYEMWRYKEHLRSMRWPDAR